MNIKSIELASTTLLEVLAAINLPISYISSISTHSDLSCLKQVSTNIDIHTLKAGHFIMLNKPKEFNATLDKLMHSN